jgi:hypothetical protein
VCRTFKPSSGLEPETPSLPWRFRGGTGGHRRALAITFLLQIVPSRRVSRARACPLVRGLMYPSRTRGVLSVLETDDAAGCRARSRVSFGLRIAYVPPAEPSNAGLCGCRSRAGHKSRGTVIGGMTGAEQRSDSELLLAARTCSEPFGSSTSGTWLRCFAFFRRRVPGCWSVAAHLLGGPGCPPHGGRASGLFGTPALSGAG